MLTLYHAPRSRASNIVHLLHELDAMDEVAIEIVSIRRNDGSGGGDPANPHPYGKVPYLVHDGAGIAEGNAILLYLTELFPEAGLGVPPGDPQRGPFLSWLAFYGNVVEPVIVAHHAGMSDNPIVQITFRGPDEMIARLSAGLEGRDYLMGDRYTVADLLLSSAVPWMPEAARDVPVIRDWAARCRARPAVAAAEAFDAERAA